MSLIRRLPLKYRLPLIHGSLWLLALIKSRKWLKAEQVEPVAGPLIVSGFHQESSGIAHAGKNIITRLKSAGFPLLEHDIRPAFKQFVLGTGRFPTEAPGGVWLLPINPAEAIVAFMAYPAAEWVHSYRIGYWAWETTRAPALWVWVAAYFNEIWVPTDFVRDAMANAFAAHGKPELTDRLRVMLHPLPDFSEVKPDRARFGLRSGVCEVLCLFDTRSAHTRKNPWAVIEAWCQAFPGESSRARLHLKVQNLDEDPETRARLERLMSTRSDITLFDTRLSDEDMRVFMASFDGLISLHRSEGFGITLAEAMAMNVSVIATGWSGNMAFMTPENSYLVPYSLKAVEDPTGMYGALFGHKDENQQWAEPDIDAAAAALKALVQDVAERQQKQAIARAGIYEALNAPWQEASLHAQAFSRYVRGH